MFSLCDGTFSWCDWFSLWPLFQPDTRSKYHASPTWTNLHLFNVRWMGKKKKKKNSQKPSNSLEAVNDWAAPSLRFISQGPGETQPYHYLPTTNAVLNFPRFVHWQLLHPSNRETQALWRGRNLFSMKAGLTAGSKTPLKRSLWVFCCLEDRKGWELFFFPHPCCLCKLDANERG